MRVSAAVTRPSMSHVLRTSIVVCALPLAVALCAGCADPGGTDGGASDGAGEDGAASRVANESEERIGSDGIRVLAEGVTAPRGLPLLLDLGADKCVPCKAMAPVLEEMRSTFEGQLAVRFIDVWKNRDAAREYGVKVIPTQIFLDGEGTELFRHQGFYSRDDMLAKWRELGYEFEDSGESQPAP
ncbi:MAG: thioredoxin fold domain-containing protein [Candidatus Eisenbacteria bacterium]|nr:thioredoxin fold domain-containing protein [Candidatus Eisenbacteria bacterium]